MRRLASYALVAAIAASAAGCAGARVHVVSSRPAGHLLGVVRDRDNDNRIGPGPFVPGGGWAGGGGSGLWADGGSGPGGTTLGCLDHRHYSYAFGVENTLKVPVTLTAAIGPNPAPSIVDRVATQLRLSPPQRRPGPVTNLGGMTGFDLVYHHWSAAPTRPVTIPPHRLATVQVNFLMRHCGALAPGRKITVSGALVLRYRASGRNGRQELGLPADRFVVIAGPKRRVCAPVSGSARLVTADVDCAFARRAAPLCRPMQNEGWLGCAVAGRFWACGRFAGAGYPLLETCYLPHEKSRWFSVVWIGRGLGIWGAIQNRRANLGWNRLDAWNTTRGVCENRPAGAPLVFESSALRIRDGQDARVKFVIRDYHGPGSYPASIAAPPGVQIESAVHVAVGHGKAATALYIATAGRVTVVHAAKGSISGTVYASLQSAGGTKRASLNGTWSCRTTVG